MLRKSIIFGVSGHKLNPEEEIFFKKTKPWGIILFSRNIKNLEQLKKLVNQIKMCAKDKFFPILIDQEGGRISRLNNIVNFNLFSQQYFANLYLKDKKFFLDNYKIYINKTCEILKSVGININTAPVLDVLRKKTNKVIGDRAFSNNARIVSKLGKICIDLYSKNKIATVVKHIPGHGLSSLDTHNRVSKVTENKNTLIKNDFLPFKNCKSLFAMTAHIFYTVYDRHNPATHSRIVVEEVIRKKIGFKGILITDDICMKSLKFDLRKNVLLALDSGCNLILHCNANLSEMRELVKIVPNIDGFVKKKTSEFYKFLS